jgi:hypothetical protein
MGRARLLLCAVSLALVTGCGDETGERMAALRYLPSDAALVAAVPTDLESEQVRRLERLLAPVLRDLGADSLRDWVQLEAPLLGSDLVLALTDDSLVTALETEDGERLREALAQEGLKRTRTYRDAQFYELYEGEMAVDGDTLLIAHGSELDKLERAIDRERAGSGLDPSALGEPEVPAIVHGIGDPRRLAGPELTRADGLPWVSALESLAFSVRLEERAVVARVRVATDPAGLGEEDLPVAPGGEPPPVPALDGAIAAGIRDPGRLVAFLGELLRLGAGRPVEALLGSVGGVLSPDVARAAVGEVADPEAMRGLLERLPRTEPVRGRADERLFTLESDDRVDLVFGMVGRHFVVGGDVEQARAGAQARATAIASARGAVVARADLSRVPLPTAPLGEAVAELEASVEALEARLRIAVPGGLD